MHRLCNSVFAAQLQVVRSRTDPAANTANIANTANTGTRANAPDGVGENSDGGCYL